MFRFDPNDIDPVVRSVERRIRREAIRQLDSIDLDDEDDEDDRVDPLPPLVASDVTEHGPTRSGRGGSH